MSKHLPRPVCECGNAKDPQAVCCAECKRLDRLVTGMWQDLWWHRGATGEAPSDEIEEKGGPANGEACNTGIGLLAREE